jgi:TM2 domain-containing membrane protein YozV
VSDVNIWGNPDRSFMTFMILSVLLGFLGFDHFYLRSYVSGFQKLFTNVFFLGIWYFWDLIQIFHDGKKVRAEGLSSPLDWIKGIGRGVFPTLEQEGKFEAPKSYLIYTFLTVCFGWLGADKFYIGNGWHGILKLFSTLNIFLFLIGIVWVLWDAFHAIFMTKSIVNGHITAPLPFSLFADPVNGRELFMVKEKATGGDGGFCFMDWLEKTFSFGAASKPSSFDWRKTYRDIAVPLMTPPIVGAVHKVTDTVDKVVAAAKNGIELPAVSNIASMVTANVVPPPSGPGSDPPSEPKPSQTGGGGGSISGPGAVIGGTLTAVVLAGGLKGFYDFISKQRG